MHFPANAVTSQSQSNPISKRIFSRCVIIQGIAFDVSQYEMQTKEKVLLLLFHVILSHMDSTVDCMLKLRMQTVKWIPTWHICWKCHRLCIFHLNACQLQFQLAQFERFIACKISLEIDVEFTIFWWISTLYSCFYGEESTYFEVYLLEL